MIDLTNDMVWQDIRKFQERIEKANAELDLLPVEAFGWQAQKALNRKRLSLLDEINHVENLIKIAQESLTTNEPNL